MVFDADNYNYRLDAGNLYVAYALIAAAAAFNSVLQIANPAASGFNARVVAIFAGSSLASAVAISFDSATQGGGAVTVRNLKRGGAAGVVTSNSKNSAVFPATQTRLFNVTGVTGQNVIGPEIGMVIPLCELTPGDFLDVFPVTVNSALDCSIVWLEVPTGVV